jgi:quercetin dioxygenase-like cupin family protein
MKSYDTRAVAQDLATLTIKPGMSGTDTDTEPPVKMLTSFNQCSIGIMRFSGRTPWERHPDGDELLQILEGGVEVTVLAEAGPLTTTIATGSIFVVPRGLWHRQIASAGTALLFVTALKGSEHSWAEDPRGVVAVGHSGTRRP